MNDTRSVLPLEDEPTEYLLERTGEKAINIIFDASPGPCPGRFIEVETDDGASINAGEWIDRHDGTWALRITELPSILAAGNKERDMVTIREIADEVGMEERLLRTRVNKARRQGEIASVKSGNTVLLIRGEVLPLTYAKRKRGRPKKVLK